MKQASYSGRPRGRSPERYKQPQKKSNGDSREGGGRPRGNPQQSVDKYLTLARDAASLGDPISAENFYQYADHYYRLVCENRASQPTQPIIREKEDVTSPPLEIPPPVRNHRPPVKRTES